MARYDPPHPISVLEEKYPHLLKDPTHRWRAEQGLEMIHKEPSLKELERIWANWQLMSPEQKKRSEEMSKKLFGLTNEENYKKLRPLYKEKKAMTLHSLMPSFSDELLEIARSSIEESEKVASNSLIRAAANYGRAEDSNEKAAIMSENSKRIATGHPELLPIPKHLDKNFRRYL
jgi:hypothetical protein